MKRLGLLLCGLALAGCQTTQSKTDGNLAAEVAGRLLAVPLLMTRCEAIDPANRTLYAAERERYERENAWISDAAYKVMVRQVPTSMDGMQAFIRGAGEKRVDEVFAAAGKARSEAGCLKALSQCRLREASCGPFEKTHPALVKGVVDAAAS